WFRNPFTQTVIVGLCAFCAPGIWSAISATGAGGTLEANLVNGVNAFSLVLTATFCLIGPWIVNLLGFRWALVVATYGYPLYSAGLYYHQVSDKTWLMWFGTLLCGSSGGIFWAVEPAIVLGYSTPETRGRHMGIWITLNNIGTLVAGAINLGFNAKTAVKGSLSNVTYLVLIGIACTGPLWALLLSNPHQVRRSNGTPVEYTKTPINLLTEFKAMFYLAKQPTILLLLPLSFYVWFQQTYTTTFLALHFTIRARALASFVLGITCMLFASLSGLWLDYKRVSLRWRARGLFLFIATLGTISWIWAISLQASFDRGAITETLDWTSHLYVAGILPYLFHNALGFGVLTGFLPWVIAELTESHDDFIRAAAFAR
ncbi:major facilitator superfamily domain-containing protein, partial [Leucosporidium creatinivorum]